jgi:hypothetical protein
MGNEKAMNNEGLPKGFYPNKAFQCYYYKFAWTKFSFLPNL